MRITYLLLFGLACCIAAATAAAPAPSDAKSKNDTTKATAADSTKDSVAAATAQKEVATKSEKSASNGREAKSLKSGAPGDNRGKRTLYDFGNAGYLYSEVASRRAGYEASGPSYYPQSGFYNGQSAIAQYPGYVPSYASYPQYLEAPEPIIEIIIKDANETLAEEPAQPIVTKKKKKKEKVHVFYVNYKKDQNNKLHLETPIASLNNDENEEEEEEEEEIVQYPVTPLPPIKTTTLRTIIHPDSEKYHSNSGIHVSFGAEDKNQLGHILEEHDAESIQRQVVALPVGSGVKSDGFLPSTRADYGRDNGFERAPNSNLLFGSGANAYHQQSPTQLFQSQQQLPVQQANNYFRPPGALVGPASTQATQIHKTVPQQPQQQLQQHHYYNKQQHQQQQHQQQYQQSHPQQHQQPHHQQHQQQQHQQHQQQQSQNYAPQTPSHSIFNKLLQQSQYYVNHNQQYQQSQQQPQHQPPPQPAALQQQQQQYYKPNPQPAKQVPFFPTIPPKTQDLPLRQTPAPYQPIKFRPTPAPAAQIKPAPIPAKLDNSNYQHKQQSQQQQQQQQHYQTQPHQQLQQQQQQQHHPKPQSLPFQFNRQPQFVQQPLFTVQSPTPQLQDYYQNQQKTQLNKYQSQSQGQGQGLSQATSTVLSPSTSLSGLHNLFDIQPSKETELLKAIPKYEQHITETVQSPIGQQQSQQQFSFSSSRNQVIHDIPAPNLGPTIRPQIQPQQQQQQQLQQQPQQQQLAGHYITAGSQQQNQYTNFVTTSQTGSNAYAQLPSSTTAPVFAESTHGQKVMVVTPVPATAYNQYQYNSNINNEAVIQVHSQAPALQAQASTNFAQQPRQTASTASQIVSALPNDNSPYSVSTYHQDVFKELQQRTQSQQQQQQTQQQTQQQSQQQQPNAALEKGYIPSVATKSESTAPTTAAPAPNGKASQTLLQLPDEVPDDLRQQLFSSGILNNADISVLDYDKVGDIALENLPSEHLQHFYGAGGGAQIAETKKVLTVVKPNGDKVALSEKDISRVKESHSLPQKQNVDVKVVRFDAQQEKNISEKYLKSDATVVPPVDLADRQYNRYLPLKVNGAQFPIPDSEELIGKRVVSVVVLAPVEASALQPDGESEARGIDTKEVKFLGGDLIKTLVKKPTKENFKRWLEKESRTDLELQSVVLLVAKTADNDEQEIFMYDITSGSVNRLNGELSSTFVSVAEENASSEDLEHAATLDPSSLEAMMHKRRR